MTGDGTALDRGRCVLTHAVWVALALAMPLLVAGDVALAGTAAAALVTLAVALLVALVSRYAVALARAVAVPTPASAADDPTRSRRVPDPVRHPLRPRAPGLA